MRPTFAPLALLLCSFLGSATSFSLKAPTLVRHQPRRLSGVRHSFAVGMCATDDDEAVVANDEEVVDSSSTAPREPAPDGYAYDDFGRLTVANKPRAVEEPKETSPVMQKVVGIFGILLTLYAAGFILNYSFSPASPLLSDNQAPSQFTDGATSKYASTINRALGDE